MTETIIVAVLALVGTLVGSVMVSQKTVWRIDQLEKKVERHNQVVERVMILELDDKNQWGRIDELRDMLEQMREEIK